MARIRFSFGALTLDADLLDTPTASAIAAALPIASSVLTWGEEVYFEIPVDIAREKSARAVVTPGEIATGRTAIALPSGSAARPFRRATKRGLRARATCSPRQLAT